MRYGSVCSGIEAASVAWELLGWKPSFFSEIDPFPRAVLTHRFPAVPLHGDFTTIQAGQYDAIDLLAGGTPCQSFSVAGLRGGLADERGNLALGYLGLAQRLRPRWLVWENVPGVLSSNGGRDFGSILGGMVELGYGFAYGVLDAQHFGVPQRRRRVFVVGYLGDWRPAAAVLFERHSLQGHSPPRREARQGIADSLTVSANECLGRLGDFVEASTGDISHCLNAGGMGRQDYETETLVTHTLRGDGFDASEDGTGRGTPLVPVAFMSNASGANLSWAHDQTPTLRVGGDGGNSMAIAFGLELGNQWSGGNVGWHGPDRPFRTFDTGTPPGVAGSAVRRLTPRECERLQGFPDDWTAVPYRGKPASDDPRYKALGNSMAVPCMAWIGQRIAAVDALIARPSERAAA